MNLPDLREEARPHHLARIIQEKASENQAILWQDFTHSKEQIIVHFVTLDEKNSKVVFTAEEDPNQKFNPALPVYFYEKDKECVFKTKILRMTAQLIEIQLPSEILTLENRLFTRKLPTNNEEVTFSIRSEKDSINFSKKVLDYSEQGLAFTIIGREYLHFYEGDKLHFDRQKSDIPLPNEVGTIVYSDKIEDSNVSDKVTYRVGVCF